MTEDGVVVGIDLGTTNSLVAVLQGGVPVVLPNAEGERMTPSAVAVDAEGHLLVGAAARAIAARDPDAAALAFKRDMGTRRELRVGERTFRPEELSAMILRALKEDAEVALGRPVREAVVTVPAYFGDLQRQATRDAAQIAGLHVERIINEPTAAALAYGLHNLDRELKAAVLDLGGGTFDVTVLEIIEGVIEVQASSGDARLGGEDFTDALAELLSDAIREKYGEAPTATGESRARLRTAAESLKRRLAHEEACAVALPGLRLERSTRDVELTVDRERATARTAPLMARMRGPILRALSDSGLHPTAIDEVLLVGGATRMPEVRRLAAELFGRMPRHDLPTDEAVALGAAVQAALKSRDAAVHDLVVTDVAPFTLGVSTTTKVGTRSVEGMFTPIIERGTVIPTSRVERLVTLEADQRRMLIAVYQGEHSTCEQNTFLGKYMIDGLPRGTAPGDTAVDVRMSYDLNGILEVEMSVVGTRRVEHLVIERNPGQLNAHQIAAARKQMERLKFHPRETLPNRTALARGDALYVELKGEDRHLLGHELSRFRALLESQDGEAIEAAREALVRLTHQIGG